MKVAIVHEFLTQYGGAERVLDCFLEMWPNAPVYTIVYDKKKMGQFYDKVNIKTSFIQKLPKFPPAGYKWWLTLFPRAIESFNLDEYDLVISNSSAFAKGVITHKPTIHVCYMLTPTRYLWSVTKEYLRDAPIPGFVRPFMPPVFNYLRKWDYKAAQKPDYIIADSVNVAGRVKKFYDRDADEAIFPFVDTSKYQIRNGKKDYYLVVARQEPYKRSDLAILAANKLGLNLVVVGSGTKMDRFTKMAGPTVKFTGRLDDKELVKTYENCIGFIFPQEEDAGITPLEAMAAGRPVIAYGKGGALETVIPGSTGEFFYEQSVQSLVEVLKTFNPEKYDSKTIRAHAEKFDKTVFKKKFNDFIENAMKNKINK